MKTTLALLAALLLAGCVTPPKTPQSRAEWQAIHVREFPGKTPEDVLDAAERVLRLADDEFTFDYPDGQLIATRPWLVYAVIAASSGIDYWRITTAPLPGGGTRATVDISRTESTIAPSPVMVGGQMGVGMDSSTMPGRPVQTEPAYNLFWSRVEHQLGLLPVWFTCDSFKAGRSAASKAGLNVLCSVNTDDREPAP